MDTATQSNAAKAQAQGPFFHRDSWLFFLGFFRGMYRRLSLTALGSAAQVLLIVPAIWLVKYAFDDAIPKGRIDQLVAIGLIILLLRLANAASAVWLRNINIKVINEAIFRIRYRLIDRMYSLPRAFHTREDPRLLHARIVQDTERLTQLSNALISRIFPSAIICLALCILLAILNFWLLLAILALIPFILLANRIMGRKISQKVVRFQRAFEQFSKGMNFVLRYMDLTQAQSAREEEMKRQSAVASLLKEETGQMASIYALNAQIQEMLTGLSGILIIVLGGIAVSTDAMTLGDFIAFYLAASFLNRHATFITTSFPDVLAGNASLQTLYALSSSADHHPYQGSDPHIFREELWIRNLWFSYGDKAILKGVDLNIRRGRKIAIVGANGSGKTTLIHLILGFYRPDEGSLQLDGKAYDGLDMMVLRRSVGWVMQHPLIFNGSIRENILYGNEECDSQALAEACGVAGVDAVTDDLPQGIETEVGEDGVRLSGGEKQRIALARALIRRPGLMILDEPTNHLDQAMISDLLSRLEKLPYQPAVLLISHDNQALSLADQVYRFQEGVLHPE